MSTPHIEVYKPPFSEKEFKAYMDGIKSGRLSSNTDRFMKTVMAMSGVSPLNLAKFILTEHMGGKEDFTDSPAFHKELIKLCVYNNRVAIAAPRGFAKSTVLTFFYVLWCALYQYKKYIVIVSASQEQAGAFLRRIRDELEGNENLKAIYGDQRTDQWSEKKLKLANGCTIISKGRGAQMRGLISGAERPDLIVMDDIEDDEQVQSELRRRDLQNWFDGAVMPTVHPKRGQIIFVGTILHEDALLTQLLNPDLYPEFTSKRYQAIEEDGTSLWEERHSIESLLAIKEAHAKRFQTARFYMEYMNDPIPEDSAVFRKEYFTHYEELPPTPYINEVYVDLGGGSVSKHADPTAIIHTIMTPNHILYVDNYVNERFGDDAMKIVDTLFQFNTQFRPQRFIIEKTQAANMLKTTLESECARRGVYLNVDYINPTRGSGDRRGKMSDGKYQRIAEMQGAFKMGAIRTRASHHELHEQLISFPRGTHDDLIDALAYAYQNMARYPEHALDPVLEPEYEPLYPELY